jgi:hypothetical protein
LAPGRYALRVFADENGNGKLDSNLMGLPIERYGFSKRRQGQPRGAGLRRGGTPAECRSADRDPPALRPAMQRRELLRLLASAGALPLLAPLARAAAGKDDWQTDFEAAGAPWKTGFATPPGDLPLARATVRGRFPDAVAGTLFRIGPAGHDLGGERYRHWFDGDGMVHRFVIDGGDVRHQGRYVATPKRVARCGPDVI